MSKARESESRRRAALLSWALLLRAGLILGRRWTALSSKERTRLAALVRQSRGRLDNLSLRQRRELHGLAKKLDLKGLRRELRPLVGDVWRAQGKLRGSR